MDWIKLVQQLGPVLAPIVPMLLRAAADYFEKNPDVLVDLLTRAQKQ